MVNIKKSTKNTRTSSDRDKDVIFCSDYDKRKMEIEKEFDEEFEKEEQRLLKQEEEFENMYECYDRIEDRKKYMGIASYLNIEIFSGFVNNLKKIE